jgi:hypothetical protein
MERNERNEENATIPWEPVDQQRRYALWRLKASVSVAYRSLPKSVVKFNKKMHQEDLTLEEVKQYLVSITRVRNCVQDLANGNNGNNGNNGIKKNESSSCRTTNSKTTSR